ncbi:MAG: heme anaerobic degradation radical SAM methyltransferase ChuW/HutW [Thermodesulfovibrionales bacterium]|nr:heme anaerobic degradation radical SAM methyltransferase ChuW/HutW [Thermodesulfovibrionales bacterium]
MQAVSKADRFVKAITDIPSVDKKWFFGNETDDPLQFAFDAKRTVHPSVKGKVMPKDTIFFTWQSLMDSQSKAMKRAVYIHIPFCQTHCLYCGFFQNFTNKELEDAYISRLIKEIGRDSELSFVKSHPIHAVYIGGGTPSALSIENIQRLLNAIHLYLPLANDYELTFEARFHKFDDEKVKACIEGGVNRFSLGVQSFNTGVRKSIGRIDDKDRIFQRLRYLMSLDNAVVVIDLMYGMPHQTMDIWENDVKTLIESEIDGGDLYQLNVFEDSRLKEAMVKGVLPPASKTSQQAFMFKRGVEIMQKSRYRRLSICHWAKNTRERNIYNQLSKSGFTTIAFGAGAGGKIEGYTFFIDRDIYSYIKRVDNNEKPLMFMMSPPEDYEIYTEIIGEMDIGRLNLPRLSTKYNIDLEEMLSPLIEVWFSKGLVTLEDGFMDLTTAGQFWYVNLTQAILDWLVMMKNNAIGQLSIDAISAQG